MSETPFENKFDDLIHKLDISETLSNVDVSNPFSDVVSSLITPVGVDSSLIEGNHSDLDNGFFEPNFIKSDEFKEFEDLDIKDDVIDSANLSITSDQNIERISNSDESLTDESNFTRDSQLDLKGNNEVGTTPLFDISVEDPQKIGDPINAHIIYRVRTRTTSDKFKSNDFTVLRRYRDFLWLYNQLTLRNPGVIVPPVPEKHAIGRFQDEFVENRRQALEKYESKGVLKSLGEAVSNATTFTKFTETDEWFENRKNQLYILDSQLKALLKSVETIVKQRKVTAEFGDNILSLSEVESNETLANHLTILGNIQHQIKELHEKQAQQDVVTLESTIDEYIRLIGSIKVAFNSRSKVYQTWKNAINDLQKKKANYEKTKTQVEECKNDFEDVTELIKAEIDRFDKEKVEDFKNSVEAFLESMVQTQKRLRVVPTIPSLIPSMLWHFTEESIDQKMNPFPHQLIYQPNGSPNGQVSPNQSPSHSPSPPTASPNQTSPSLGYPVSHNLQTIYSGNSMHLYSLQSKLQPKLQPSLGHAFGPHSLLNQTSGPPGQALMPPVSHAMNQPQLNISLNTGVTNTNNLTVVSSTHWQSQLNYAQLSPIAITDPNNPNKPPVNGVLNKKEVNGDKDKQDQPFQQWMIIDLGGMGLKNINISGNKLSVLPSDLGMLTNLKELLLFDNNIVTLPYELGTLYQLETLGIEGNPISEAIKSLLQKEGTTAVISFLRDNCQVPPHPMERDWIMLETDTVGGERDSFTLLCYNILCEKYATTQLYGYTPSWALAWDYRKELIVGEVLSYNADIVCLQDAYHKHGDYDSVYWPKSRAKTMSDWEKKSVDGFALQRPDIKKTEDMFNRVITKDNIAIVTLLENKENSTRIIIANCHIHWDPSYADVKLVQVAMLMDEIDKLSHKWSTLPNQSSYNYNNHPNKMSTIICGDFNSTPDSGVYEFLSRGTIKQDHGDFGDHIYGSYTSGGLSHGLSLKSSYSNIEELPFTNFTPSFTGVIDYIWYSTNTLTVTGLLGGVDREYLSKMVGFPNAHFPSE
ncbi:6977_t:CDS:10 [Diversispora eburnea]|uniref:6977_t:CDS:1 n=1 Tax=Diversispora eburnea TaxID=1213867 RepID=A0A9N8YQS0_9GLOM|nr:6977_t:CDS:10 [Diversispora eburnea]